ncbi:MAG: FtsW/RodA/SpoVE family cell cycle protein [Micrococcales bacterium]|nr:FtsW/RodA/SpoVE family cell cycle protein [Micrococcales bacterium]
MATVAPSQVRSGRGVELALLVVALTVAVASYALVNAGAKVEGPVSVLKYGAGMAGLALVAHLVVRWRAPYADPVILPTVIALNGIGLAMIYRIHLALLARATVRDDGTLKVIPHGDPMMQLLWSALSMVLALVLLIVLRDHRTLRRYTYTAMIVSVVLLLLPMLPVLGKQVNGARIWIDLRVATFQPGELAKITLAIFFAGYLVTNRDTLALAGRSLLGMKLPRAQDLGPILLVWGVTMVVLVAQKDLGTSLLMFGLFLAVLYLATERISWVLLGLGLLLVGATVAARVFSHVGIRFTIWRHAMDQEVFEPVKGSPGYPWGSGQLVRGLFGMGSGGMLGTGWGQGRPDLVPYAESDFVIASLGEELGLTGLMAILVLFMVLVERGMRTALGVRDGFGKLLAGGLSFLIALQMFVVVGGITRIIPLTGLTAPFIAYGGSSLLGNWLIVGLLLRISDDARRPDPSAKVATPAGGIPVSSRPSADSAIVVAGSGGSAPAVPAPAVPAGPDQAASGGVDT